MPNKVLVVESDAETRLQIEEVLQKMLEGGGEIFFTERTDEALQILHKEKPQIVFLDLTLMGEDKNVWQQSGVHLVFLVPPGYHVQPQDDHISKPVKGSQVLEKCQKYLSSATAPSLPPM